MEIPSSGVESRRGRQWDAWWLMAGSALLLLTGLGAGDLWTQEERWALICQEMIRSGDYVHPWLVDRPYYDKPLLSYWLMVGLAGVLGALDGWALRLPSALSALVAVWCTWRLGLRLLGRQAGLLAGTILATTFFFIFWGRVASADMLNLAGIIAAVTWYFERSDRGFLFHLVFFTFLAVTSLMKGLIGAVIPLLILLPTVLRGGVWRAHLRAGTLVAALPAAAFYLTPFALSGTSGGQLSMQEGLGQVFRENVERFFSPYDHQGSVFTYFAYLPLYFLPWTVFLPFAAWEVAANWKRSAPGMRWAALSAVLVFAFLTASGSRRSYYVLPLLPFVALLTAGWISPAEGGGSRRRKAAAWLAATAGVVLFGWFGLVKPSLREVAGMQHLAREVHAVLERKGPPESWRYVLWQGPRRAAAFYLSPHRRVEWLAGGEAEVARLKALLAQEPRTAVVTTRRSRQEVLALIGDPLEFQKPDWRDRLEGVKWLPRSLRRPSSADENVVVVLPRLD